MSKFFFGLCALSRTRPGLLGPSEMLLVCVGTASSSRAYEALPCAGINSTQREEID